MGSKDRLGIYVCLYLAAGRDGFSPLEMHWIVVLILVVLHRGILVVSAMLN